MTFNMKDIEKFLNSSSSQEIEQSIAEKLNCKIYSENLPFFMNLIKDEIDASGIDLSEIESFIEVNKHQIIEFGVKYLRKYKPKFLAIGISITYSIYLIYLQNKSEEELLFYLDRRRLPKPKQVLKELQNIDV